MEVKKTPIGLVIKRIAKKKKLTVNDLSVRIGMSRQSIYNMFAIRRTMNDEDMAKWASALGVSVQELQEESMITETFVSDSEKSPESARFGNDVVERIEEHFRHLEDLFREQLRAKDQQIAKLQETIITLVGKTEGATLRPLHHQKLRVHEIDSRSSVA